MRHLFFKSLRKSRTDYGVVIFCGIFIVSIVYITAFISDSMIQITTGERGSATDVYINLGVFILTYVILGILMVLMIISYIRKRSYEYAMFDILGMKKKHRYRFIGCEYGGIILSSMAGGIVLGRALSIAILPVLRLLLRDDSLKISRNLIPLRLTAIIGVMIFGFTFMICDELISCLGIDAVLSMGKRSGKKYRFSPVLTAIGIVFTVVSVVMLFSYWGKVNKAIPAAVVSVGIYCLMVSGCSIWLGKVRRSRGYYKKVLWMEQWYHRFYANVTLSVILAIFILVNLFSFGIQICNHVPTLSEEDYPYDLVWMANDTDADFIRELEETYGIELISQRCVRVTTPDFGEHMGIPASAYEAMAGEKVDLEGQEIYVVYQRNREERNLLGIDYGSGRPRLYIGNARGDLWIFSGAGLLPSNAFKREYSLVGETQRVMTGIYQSRAVGEWVGEVWEQVIVFSDEYFQEIEETAEGANLAVLLRLPEDFPREDYERLKSEIYAYAREHSQINFLDWRLGNLIYERETELPQNQQDQILRLSAAGINMFILILCMICILWVKGKSDYEDMRWKYQFYEYSGMEKRKQRKCMRKELFLTAMAAFLGGVPVTWILVGADIAEKEFDMGWNLRYLGEMLGISGAVMVLLVMVETIFAARIIRKIMRSEL